MESTTEFILTKENYYSIEANQRFMSASQFKAFQRCEEAALAEVNGKYRRKETESLLVGSYIDAYFSNELDHFRSLHPEIYKRDGSLRAEYVHANEIIKRIEADRYMMELLSGEPQVIRTGTISGVPFKIKMDFLHPDKIVDLKIMRDFKPVYVEGQGKMPFVEGWGYDYQGAIYQAVEGHSLPFVLAAATKEEVPDIAAIGLPEYLLSAALAIVENGARRYAAIKRGEIAPRRCEHCDYCKATKVLTHIIPYDSFILQNTLSEESEESE
jgi:hypothetical protein